MQDLQVPLSEGGSINVWHRPARPDSPTILLVHGLTGTSRWWIPVLSHLPSDLGLVVPDVRGRGGSRSAPDPYDIVTLADDLSRVIDHLGVTVSVVAGYSMGAWITAVFSNRHPGRAQRLVLIDGGLPVPVDRTLDDDEILDSLIGPSLRRLSTSFVTREGYYDFYREHPAFIGWWKPDLGTVLDYEIREVGDGFEVDANPDAVAESGRGIIVADDTIGAGREVTVPTELLIVDHGMLGQPGGFIPLDVAREATQANPNLHYTMIEGLNHYSLMMGPGAPIVAGFITRQMHSRGTRRDYL